MSYNTQANREMHQFCTRERGVPARLMVSNPAEKNDMNDKRSAPLGACHEGYKPECRPDGKSPRADNEIVENVRYGINSLTGEPVVARWTTQWSEGCPHWGEGGNALTKKWDCGPCKWSPDAAHEQRREG